jgi:Nucleotidyl transferase AbiEii toxin, Type IV TA system
MSFANSTLTGPYDYCAGLLITIVLPARQSPHQDSSSNNDCSCKRSHVNDVIQAAAELQAFCSSEGWQFCFIGGIAVLRWGEPRETVDVDLTVLAGFGGETPFIDRLLRQFEPRIDHADEFARRNRVLLLKSPRGVGLDIAFGALPFEEKMIERSSLFEYPMNATLRTCSAEDLIILKAFASRTQDWADIERVIVRQTGKLDWEYVNEQLTPLIELKAEPAIIERLQRQRQEFEQ